MWVANPPWISFPGICCRRQMVPYPDAHSSHSPQGMTEGTITAFPCHGSAPAPAATTRPLISWPSASGRGDFTRTPS
jgi:hypothetical protein